MTNPAKACRRCLLDETLSSLRLDENAVCTYCHSHDRLMAFYTQDTGKKLETLLETIRREGQGKPYDCIVGISGGTDSSYLLMEARERGLRPLAVHFDNGWNSDTAISNIKRITNALEVELITYVVEWEEFKDLQVAFLEAATPCVETPSDVGIHGAIMGVARRYGVRTILGGQSFMTEGTVPKEWGYLDGTYIRTIQKRFGHQPLKSFPNVTPVRLVTDILLHGIRQIPLLNYLDYDKERAKEVLRSRLGWRDYSGHHYENLYSKFAFGWYLPRKFNIDKRKVSLSGPVRCGRLSREEALARLQIPPQVDETLVHFVRHKLGLSEADFQRILALPNRTYRDYYTSDSLLRHLRPWVGFAVKHGLFPPVLYEKYFTE